MLKTAIHILLALFALQTSLAVADIDGCQAAERTHATEGLSALLVDENSDDPHQHASHSDQSASDADDCQHCCHCQSCHGSSIASQFFMYDLAIPSYAPTIYNVNQPFAPTTSLYRPPIAFI